MWAQKLVKPGVFELVQSPDPDPEALNAGETLLRLEAGAVCGSDLPYFAGATCIHIDDSAKQAANLPGFPLHEIVGQVVASDDPELPVGSRAVGWAMGFTGLAEYTVTESSGLMAVPDDVSSKVALSLQPLACVVETVRMLGPLANLRVAVLGLGPFGLLFAHALHAAGAATVMGVDRIDRSDVAAKFGVDIYVHSAIERWARNLDDAERPDIVIEAVGHQTATISDALEAVAFGGKVFGFGVPDDPFYPIPMQLLFRKSATLTGGIVTERRPSLERALEYQSRYPELQADFVTHTFDIADAQEAFELASKPAIGRLKVQITF